MAQIKIEMDRGDGWTVRAEGHYDADAGTAAGRVIADLPGYAIQYPHRAFVNGVLVATAERPHGARGKVRIVRHDG